MKVKTWLDCQVNPHSQDSNVPVTCHFSHAVDCTELNYRGWRRPRGSLQCGVLFVAFSCETQDAAEVTGKDQTLTREDRRSYLSF
jgi:hypothetical protein